VTGHRCTVCDFPQASDVDALLGSGSSVRSVARLYGLSRTTLGRHKAHLAPTSAPFALIRGEGGPDGPTDPLAEALGLAARARTPRQKLRALEQVRAATKLLLRGNAEPDQVDQELLDGNVRAAEDAYAAATDFETEARALSGLREAIVQRLDAQPKAQALEVSVVVTDAGGKYLGSGRTFQLDPVAYWQGVPQRYRNPNRFIVQRTIALGFPPAVERTKLKVYEAGGGLIWAKE